MDLGRFMRSRLQFGLWLGVPVFLVLAVTAPSLIVLRQARQDLRHRQELLNAMPALEIRVRKADELLKLVTPQAQQSGPATEQTTARLDQASKNAGLTLRSVKVDENLVAASGFQTLRITTEVQGSLRSVVKWLDEVQKPGLLISVYSSTLQTLNQASDELFAGEVVLILHLRSS